MSNEHNKTLPLSWRGCRLMSQGDISWYGTVRILRGIIDEADAETGLEIWSKTLHNHRKNDYRVRFAPENTLEVINEQGEVVATVYPPDMTYVCNMYWYRVFPGGWALPSSPDGGFGYEFVGVNFFLPKLLAFDGGEKISFLKKITFIKVPEAKLGNMVFALDINSDFPKTHFKVFSEDGSEIFTHGGYSFEGEESAV